MNYEQLVREWCEKHGAKLDVENRTSAGAGARRYPAIRVWLPEDLVFVERDADIDGWSTADTANNNVYGVNWESVYKDLTTEIFRRAGG